MIPDQGMFIILLKFIVNTHMTLDASHSFSVSHMAILDIIYSTLSDASDQETTLDSVPDAFWNLYIDLFFEKT